MHIDPALDGADIHWTDLPASIKTQLRADLETQDAATT